MAVSLSTLVRLLEELCEELQVCLAFEEKPAKPSPIMVGDFAADAYNGYLGLAKQISDDPLIQSFQEIDKLGEYDRPMEHAGEWGTDPRMHKMREVSFSARRLDVMSRLIVMACVGHPLSSGTRLTKEWMKSRSPSWRVCRSTPDQWPWRCNSRIAWSLHPSSNSVGSSSSIFRPMHCSRSQP